jgi:hypothetical protein
MAVSSSMSIHNSIAASLGAEAPTHTSSAPVPPVAVTHAVA